MNVWLMFTFYLLAAGWIGYCVGFWRGIRWYKRLLDTTDDWRKRN